MFEENKECKKYVSQYLSIYLGGAEVASISEDTGEDAQPQHF